DEVGNTPRLERGNGGLERREVALHLRHNYHSYAATQLACDVEVGAVDAEHQRGACPYGGYELRRIEGIYADLHPRLHQLAHDIRERGELQPGRAADVYVVGARLAVVLRLATDLLAGESRCVVDLRDDLDVPCAVLAAECGLTEVLG